MRSLSILIVDDCNISRKLLRTVLSGFKFHANIHELEDGRLALNHYQNGYDIIFLDIQMPGINGLDVLKQIKTHAPKQFVTIITADATSKNVQTVLEFGGDGFIAKPYTTKKIKDVVDSYCLKNKLEPLE